MVVVFDAGECVRIRVLGRSWSPRSSQHANSNTNAISFVVVRVVLQLLTPVVVRSRRRIVVVPSFSCRCNRLLGPKPDHRRRLRRSVSPVEPPLFKSVAAKSPLSSRVTRHSHRSRARLILPTFKPN